MNSTKMSLSTREMLWSDDLALILQEDDQILRQARHWTRQLVLLLQKDEVEGNLTRKYLFDPKTNAWEKILKSLIRYGCSQGNSHEDMHDFATEFLSDLICKEEKKTGLVKQTDVLRPFLEEGKEIKISVLTAWFNHFMIRKWQVIGKDASGRTITGAQSQAERKNKKRYTDTLEGAAKIHLTGGDESGRNMNVDYSQPDEETADEALHRQIVRENIVKQIDRRFGERAGFYHSLYQTEIDGTFKTKSEWARSWNLPYNELNKAINNLHSAIRDLGEEARF